MGGRHRLAPSLPEKQDIDRIRDVRNAFAHRLSGLSFTTSAIATQCLNLEHSKVGEQPSEPRQCFTKASFRIIVKIAGQINAAATSAAEIDSLGSEEVTGDA